MDVTVGGPNSSTISLQNQSVSRSSSSDPLNSRFLTGSSPSSLGSRSFSFENVERGKRSERPFFLSFDPGENVDEDFDEYLNQPEKKRRLTTDQVQFLERSFEVENKLEPERKYQLAKDLGLQPRQVAIWFQNRRARWKTKYLEKDYESLQASYNSLRADYDSLLKEKENLKDEVLHLKDMLQHRHSNNEVLESSSPEEEYQQPPQEPLHHSVSEGEVSRVSVVASRQGHLISARSDYDNNGGQSSLLQWCDSSYLFEPDQSDLSQDEEDNFGKTFLTPPASVLPVIEDSDSCYFGFPVEDHSFQFWSL